MQKELTVQNHNIAYSVRLSRRARRARISVGCDSAVVVTLPWGFRETDAEKFVKEKFNWIVKCLNYFKRFPAEDGNTKPIKKNDRHDYIQNRTVALQLAENKVRQWNSFYGFSYNRISIKNQKTRWGSCSKKGNLNFNYKIVHLPENLTDYLIVHELCHLKHMNHSRNFWALVGQSVPNYKKLRRELRNFGGGYAKV
jgi:predicted metal-dependent hydrolase